MIMRIVPSLIMVMFLLGCANKTARVALPDGIEPTKRYTKLEPFSLDLLARSADEEYRLNKQIVTTIRSLSITNAQLERTLSTIEAKVKQRWIDRIGGVNKLREQAPEGALFYEYELRTGETDESGILAINHGKVCFESPIARTLK